MNIKKYIQNANSWNNLNNTLSKFTKSNQSKLAGDIFEYLTKLYLETAPQYKSKLKKVYLLNEVPTTLKKKINLPDTDEGIDLVAVTNDNEYWAIQCKYRSDPNQTLTIKEDLATFNNLAFTYCKNISHAIVCATVSKPPKKIKLLKSIGFETLETWLALDDGDLFTQIRAKASGRVIKPKPLSPRPHQIAAIKKTKEHFKSNERGKIIMPCGTGKSLTAFWIAKDMGVKSILVAVPSLALLQQTLKVWTREFLINDIEPEWFCVCSDGTVKDEQDDYVTDTSDLGIKVETDPKLIKQFLKKKTSKIKVVFTTYQSGRATAKGSKDFTYDLGIMDEAHKTVGSKTKEMAHLLHQKNIKIRKRIFMTATERLFRGDSDEFMSMDDPRDYGSLIYELSFKQAINSKPPIISDYKIITFGITVPEIEEIYNSNKYLEVKKVLKDITARELATALALRKAIKKLKINNAISFHRSIRRADNFRTQQELITKIYPEYGKLKSFHVRGEMPTADRAVQMREFAKGKGLMTNARCLTEGVDLPAIDCVCFTDPKRSKVDIVQAAGRALRLSKGKKFGYILIPIFIPAGADFNEAAEEQGFEDVAITVRALASSDTRISEYLRIIAEGKKPRGGSPVEGLTSVNSLLKIEAEEFDKAIKLNVWKKVAKGNWRTFKDAKQFVSKLGLKNWNEWVSYSQSRNKPFDIPAAPNHSYKYEGWKSIDDWLGLKGYMSFEQAKKFIQKKKFKKEKDLREWLKSGKRPLNFPSAPTRIYKDEWISIPDFLGTTKNYKSYEEHQQFIRKNKINTKSEYKKVWKKLKPEGIYFGPDKNSKRNSVFISKWKNWSDFLGNSSTPMNFFDAKKFARKLNINFKNEWLILYEKGKVPKNIPKFPDSSPHYKPLWSGWHDFLGSKKISGTKRIFYSINKFKKIIYENKITGQIMYTKFFKKVKDPKLPSNPLKQYRLLHPNLKSIFLEKYCSYDELKDIIRKEKISGMNEYKSKWNILKKKYNTIPSRPQVFFKKFYNYEDLFGIENTKYTITEIITIIHKEKIKGIVEYRKNYNELKIKYPHLRFELKQHYSNDYSKIKRSFLDNLIS